MPQRSPFDFSYQDYPEVEPFQGPRSVGARRAETSYDAPSPGNFLRTLMDSIKPQPTPGLDRYRALVSNVPKMEDYQPSKWRRAGAMIAGGLAGFGPGNAERGYNIGQKIVNQPYENALSQFSLEEQGLRQAATREVEDVKAQNQYLKNIFDAYSREIEGQRKTERVVIGQRGQTERTTATLENKTAANVLNNATNALLASLRARSAEAISKDRLEQGAASDKARLGAAGISAGASRYGADQRRATGEYTADKNFEAAQVRESQTPRLLNAAQTDALTQRFLASKASEYSSLFGEYGPIQIRKGTGGNPTGELILAQTAEEVDEEFLPDYFKLLSELDDYLNDAEKRLNPPNRGVQIPPPREVQTPSVPSVRKVNPPGTKKEESPNERKITINGRTVTVRKK